MVQFRINSEIDIAVSIGTVVLSPYMYDQANKSYGLIMPSVQYSIRYSKYGMK
jgi:hypothetical protein